MSAAHVRPFRRQLPGVKFVKAPPEGRTLAGVHVATDLRRVAFEQPANDGLCRIATAASREHDRRADNVTTDGRVVVVVVVNEGGVALDKLVASAP